MSNEIGKQNWEENSCQEPCSSPANLSKQQFKGIPSQILTLALFCCTKGFTSC